MCFRLPLISGLLLSLAISIVWESAIFLKKYIMVFILIVFLSSPLLWFIDIYKTFSHIKFVAGTYRVQEELAVFAVKQIKKYNAGYFAYDPSLLT